MKNCITCKLRITNECDYGKAINELREYIGSEDGLGMVVNLLEENIEQYIDCDCYESI